MLRWMRLGLPVGLALGFSSLAGVAQVPPQQAPAHAAATLHARSGPLPRTVALDLVVTSKQGPAVSGLSQSDFTLLDNKAPTPITSFEAVDTNKQPVEAILLIDAVNIGYAEIAQERYQVDKFLRANGGKLTLPTALAVFGNKGVQMQGAYSRDGNGLATALASYTIGLREVGRSAGVEGAEEHLNDSLKALRMLAAYESKRPGRKIILWVSPGWQLLSGPRIDLSGSQRTAIFADVTWLSTTLREAQTTVYAVNPLGVGESVSQAFYYEQFTNGVKSPSDINIGNLGLQVIATETGGLVLNSTDVAGLLQQCVDENVAYYRLTFEPPPTEKRDVYHSLKVTVAKPGLTARTSTGYYAEP